MPRIGLWLAAALALAFAGSAAGAPLQAYGDLPSIEQVAISPNGDLLAFDYVKGVQRTIVVESLSQKKIVTGLNAGARKIRDLAWAGDGDLIITSSTTSGMLGVLVARSEWFIAEDFNLATHAQTSLLGDMDMSGNFLGDEPVVRMIDGKPTVFAVGFRVVSYEGRTTLFKVDLASHRSTVVSDGYPGTQDYLVGLDGHPLAETEYYAEAKQWVLKVFVQGAWRQAEAKRATIEMPQLLGLGRDGRSILVGGLEDGRLAVRELSPDGAKLSDPLPGDWEGGLIHNPVDHRLIGIAHLEGDDWRYQFFDPSDQAQWNVITAAFPGETVRLVSSSDDRKVLVLRVNSPTDGPGYALVDLRSGASAWLGAEHPGVASADIGPVQPVSFKAADGLPLTGYLTLPHGREAKGLPLVVFPHGGPAARDEPGFDWWAQAMASRGYAVLQVNYRGSDGFGWKFQSAGFGEWGRKMQTDLSDGVRYLAAQGTIDPKRVCIVGASYGGYAAMAGATLDPGVYRCAVDVSGPVELRRFVAWAKDKSDISTQRYWTRYMGAEDLGDPHLEAISPADQAAKVSIPILLIHGKDDTVVPFEQTQMMADALKRAGKPYDLVILNHEDHWLSHGDTRLQMLQATIDFLEKNNPTQ